MNVLTSFRKLLLTRHQIAKSWKRKGNYVIGWSSSYTPEEVITAMGGLPILVYGDPGDTKLADTYIPSNSCSFARSGFNSALKGDYDYLDGLVASNSCDNRNKIFDLWKYYLKIPYTHFINVPRKDTNSAHSFFYEENLRFKASLEKAFNRKISDDELENAIQTYNDNRLLLKEVYELRREDPPLISGVEALEIVLSSMLTKKEEHNNLLKKLLAEINKRSDSPKKGLRLLLSGSVMDNVKIIKTIENMEANVVADDWCTGSRYFWDIVESNDEPLYTISKRYLGKTPSSFMFKQKERFSHTIEMVKKFNVEAVIIFTLKFCDTHLFDAPQLKDTLEALNLPVLHLEWEHSLSGIASLKTRVEAFIEMVKGIL